MPIFLQLSVAGCLALSAAWSMGAEGKSAPDSRKLPAATKRPIDFQKDIRPILTRSCLGCHGPEKQRGGLRLDSRAEALRGGNSGSILHPGDALKSRLLLAVAGLDADLSMPPKGKTPLTAEEIGHLRAWIEQGLSWPAEGSATVGGPKSNHWAFIPPHRSPVPEVRGQKSEIRNPIDLFIRSRLEKEDLTSSPEADRTTLIRRLSLDLIGLPPTPAEVDDFLRDASPGAYERLVERLLSSPHYGEKWGRHWLDAARYADSDGYEKDTGRPFAWRWRDWVIDALNRDLPYDRFIIEQLAGDLLAGATTDQKVATGFHRNTLTNKEGGVDQEQFRVEAVVDRVNTTARVFLGLTLGCAQCHDHKYDPFSQREYYQLFAFFNRDVEANIPAPTPAGNAEYAKRKAIHDEQLKVLLAELEAAKKKLDPNLPPAEVKKKLAGLQAKLAAHKKATPQPPLAQTLALGKPRPTHVMIRGDFLRKGVEVQAGTLAIFPGIAGRQAALTRLDLARWIASPDNPLTARVVVNWMWQRYFGRGLVATLEDFGTQGEKPSHPELLDWLATEMTHPLTLPSPPSDGGEGRVRGWSLKAMHRLIVTSATYRQSSKVRPELVQRDPLNVLLARQSRLRLEAELIRDGALAASGLLERGIGGPSVRPPQPPGISELTYAGSARWIESTGPDRYRRGLYTWFQRTSPYPMLLTFDAPDGNVCTVRREKTNTPLQALTTLNDAVFVECAQALGKRIIVERPKGDTAERIRHGFRLVLGRSPTAREVARLTRLLDELLDLCRSDPKGAAKLLSKPQPGDMSAPEAAAWVALARVLLNLDEVVTRD
jgi:hypothetical protein